jgi:cbb3-type cytochrome oxidase subunit 3
MEACSISALSAWSPEYVSNIPGGIMRYAGVCAMRKQQKVRLKIYCKRILSKMWEEGLGWGRDQFVVAFIIVLIATWVSIRLGYMKAEEGSRNILGAGITYAIGVVLFIFFLAIRAPWLLDNERQEEVDTAEGAATAAKKELESEIARHGGPEISFSWGNRILQGTSTNKTLFIENTGEIDAYDVRISDVGINKQHCGARFPVIPKFQKDSRTELHFELFGDSVPESHRDEFEMVVYASKSNFLQDERNRAYVELN